VGPAREAGSWPGACVQCGRTLLWLKTFSHAPMLTGPGYETEVGVTDQNETGVNRALERDWSIERHPFRVCSNNVSLRPFCSNPWHAHVHTAPQSCGKHSCPSSAASGRETGFGESVTGFARTRTTRPILHKPDPSYRPQTRPSRGMGRSPQPVHRMATDGCISLRSAPLQPAFHHRTVREKGWEMVLHSMG
jgi:hypothetical protein